MNTKFVVRNWKATYEVAQNKKTIYAMHWVSMPTDINSTDHIAIVCHPNGPAHLGVWHSIIFLAARVPQVIRDGSVVTPTGKPLSLVDISNMARIPLDLVTRSG